MPSTNKPLASLSLDLDDKWTYMKTHGDQRWSEYPSYLAVVVPRTLRFLAERNLKITYFLVGQDAAFERNHGLFRSIREAGHQIGNHSFHHEPWLHLYSEADIESEFKAAESAIEQAAGVCPRGFRGPGFSVSETVIKVLLARGYLYDASTLPTFLGPLARAYYFFTAKLEPEEKKKRAKLFGTLADGLRPLALHRWQTPGGSLVEVPVTTMPVFRVPFHLSYLVYLASYSLPLAKLYLQIAVAACRWRGVAPSFLLHPLDFVGPTEAAELSFFPGMQMPLERKLAIADWALSALTAHFEMVPLETQVARAEETESALHPALSAK